MTSVPMNRARALPPPGKVAPVVDYAALDWHEAPAFMAALRAGDGIGARLGVRHPPASG